MAITRCLAHLQVHPLPLDLQDHLNDLQDVRKGPLPLVHLLLEGLDIAGGLHGGQGHLVVLQHLEHLICGSKEKYNSLTMQKNKFENYTVVASFASSFVQEERLSFGSNWKESTLYR